MAVANITEAIDEVIEAIFSEAFIANPGTLRASFVRWMDVFGQTLPGGVAPLNESSLGNRTVRNWQFQSLIVLNNLPADPNATRVDFQRVAEVVYRTCSAARQATIAGDITAAQEGGVGTGIVGQYNIAWP
jgi:hypothetical protein